MRSQSSGIAAGAWILFSAFSFAKTPGWGYDFEAYLLAAYRLANGDSPYLAWTLAAPFRPGPYGLYLYAPPLAVALLPFTALSVPGATAAWFVVRGVLLIGVVPPDAAPLADARDRAGRGRDQRGGAGRHEPRQREPAGAVRFRRRVAVPGPTAGRRLDRLRHDGPPDLRDLPGLVGASPALASRSSICIATGLAIIVLTLPFVGVAGYRDFLILLRNLSDVTGVPNNQDLGSSVARLGLPSIASTGALFLGYVIAVVAIVASLRRGAEISFLVTLGATLLLSPLLWDHYLVLVLPVIGFLLERRTVAGAILALLTLFWMPAWLAPFVALGATLGPFLARPARGSTQPDEGPYAAGSSSLSLSPT